MMNEKTVSYDERTNAEIGAGCRLAFLVLSFGVLSSAAVRAWFFGQRPWDLLGLYLAGNLVLLFYQKAKKASVFSWPAYLFFGAFGALFGVVLVLLRNGV